MHFSYLKKKLVKISQNSEKVGFLRVTTPRKTH
jgi:hypothetical protein